MTKRSYTDAQRGEALDLYDEVGAAEAARLLEFEVEANTIRVWAHRDGRSRYSAEKTEAATQASQHRQAERREELRETLLSKAMDMLMRMDEPHIDYKGKDAMRVEWPKAPASACQSYMIAAATALDKYRLEMGEATSRTHTRIDAESEVDGELRRTIAEWQQQHQTSPDTR